MTDITKQITYGDIENILYEGGVTIGGNETDEGIEFALVEEGEWEQDHKSQDCRIIFTDGAEYFMAWVTRSGSPFTDWTYDSEIYGSDSKADVYRCEKKTVTIEQWVQI